MKGIKLCKRTCKRRNLIPFALCAHPRRVASVKRLGSGIVTCVNSHRAHDARSLRRIDAQCMTYPLASARRIDASVLSERAT